MIFCPPPFLLPTPHNIPPQNVRTILRPTLKITASLSFHFPGSFFLQLVSSSGCACVWAAGRASFASDWPGVTNSSRREVPPASGSGRTMCHHAISILYLLDTLCFFFLSPTPTHLPFFSDVFYCSQLNFYRAPNLHLSLLSYPSCLDLSVIFK